MPKESDQTNPVAPEVDLDQATEDLWLMRNLSSGFADESLARLAALIAEARAHRAPKLPPVGVVTDREDIFESLDTIRSVLEKCK